MGDAGFEGLYVPFYWYVGMSVFGPLVLACESVHVCTLSI